MARFSQSGGGNPDLGLIKTKRWGYPQYDSVAVVPSQAGAPIALKSSGGAQLRWHIRDTGRSVVDYQVNILSVASMNFADYNGMTYVTFNIDQQDIPLPTGGIYYDVNVTNGNGDFNGSLQASDTTINTITLIYNGDITGWDITGLTGNLGLPSIYSQVQAESDGVWIKNDNWSQEPYENNWWQFQRDGGLKFPDGSVQYSSNAGSNTADIFYSTNNGNGTNYKVGDDAWIGDVNAANYVGIKGVEDETKGGIVFGALGLTSITTDSTNLSLSASNDVILNPGSNYAYVGTPAIDGSNRIAKLSDIPALPTATRWSPTFQATGLTFTGTDATYPTYNSYYTKYGQMVTFWITVDLTTITDFGTGQFKVDLPVAPLSVASNHFPAWAWVDPSQPADELNGHIQVMADHIAGSQTLDLHWLKATTTNPKPVIESLLTQGNPVTFTTASKLYINGTYISAA